MKKYLTKKNFQRLVLVLASIAVGAGQTLDVVNPYYQIIHPIEQYLTTLISVGLIIAAAFI